MFRADWAFPRYHRARGGYLSRYTLDRYPLIALYWSNVYYFCTILTVQLPVRFTLKGEHIKMRCLTGWNVLVNEGADCGLAEVFTVLLALSLLAESQLEPHWNIVCLISSSQDADYRATTVETCTYILVCVRDGMAVNLPPWHHRYAQSHYYATPL